MRPLAADGDGEPKTRSCRRYHGATTTAKPAADAADATVAARRGGRRRTAPPPSQRAPAPRSMNGPKLSGCAMKWSDIPGRTVKAAAMRSYGDPSPASRAIAYVTGGTSAPRIQKGSEYAIGWSPRSQMNG